MAAGAAAAIAAPHEAEQLTLFHLGEDMRALRARAAELASQTQATSTARAYDCDWREFVAWCDHAGRDPLPASPDTVMLFVTQQLMIRKPSTVERRLAAISHMHRAHKLRRPVNEDVRDVLKGWVRVHGANQQSKKALTVQQLRQMVRELPKNAAGARDRALLLFGFATGLRRSELSALDLSDITFTAKGVRVFIRRSKTDQAGKGREVGIFPGKKTSSDPVIWLERYLDIRGRSRGPLWLAGDGQGGLTDRRMSADAIYDAVQRACDCIGLDPRQYGAHSLRAGCVTTAIEMGVPESLVMQLTGHKSHAVLAGYVRPARVLSIDVLAGAM